MCAKQVKRSKSAVDEAEPDAEVKAVEEKVDFDAVSEDEPKGGKAAEGESVRGKLEKDKIEEEIPEVEGEKRKKVALWLWRLGFLAAALVLGAVLAVATIDKISSEKTEESSEQVGEQGTPEECPEKSGEDPEKPAESETKPEPEKSAEEKPAEEKPAKQEPIKEESSKGESLQPIESRPEQQPSEYKGEPGKKLVALTFDDGPSPYTTPRLLDILREKGVKVTFFALGTMAERSPEILRREVAEGHEVASHTPYHNQLTKLTVAQVRAEAVEMDRIFTEILGTRPPFTRPPYGAFNAMVQNALAQPLVLWSVDPRDWADRNSSVVCSRVVNAARDGSIILVHDIHATTVDAVPCIINTLQGWGFEFLTVSELAAAKGAQMVNGGAYYSF